MKGAFGVLISLAAPAMAEPWQDNLRWAFDTSVRYEHFDEANRNSAFYYAGLDLHKVFSNKQGDYATLVFQSYFTQLQNRQPVPGPFDDDDDHQLIYRIVTLNFTRMPLNLPNFKLGHIELPFGLEHNIDTNGRLLDYGLMRKLGAKADWGIGVNQSNRHYMYEFTLTTGGGQDPKRKQGSYLFTGRVATPADDNFNWGVSVAKAELGQQQRWRIGIDASYYFGLWGLRSEVSSGEQEQTRVGETILELRRVSTDETWLGYLHWIYNRSELANVSQHNQVAQLGIRYTPDQQLDISVQVQHELSITAPRDEETLARIQLRYRF